MRIALLLPLLFFLAQPLAAQGGAQLTVTGQGRAEAAPDMATLTLGVTHNAVTAEEAMGLVSADLSRIFERLRAVGIAERDLQTAGLRLAPVRSLADQGQRREITGFRASNTLRVRQRDLDGLGATLDAVLADGANLFEGLRFGLQDPTPVEDEARRRAVADAARKAALYAGAAGRALGAVVSIREGGAERPEPMRLEAAAAAGGGVPVAPGEVSFSARVTVVYALGE
ncbi:SIMPL domain-containing protein [Rhodovulum sp. ES.010]|uniref:SIMPL domain-containing protein n=1 Tax=Rhodovulum sp. ES.010 TaxID=1882821 RepID=UPI000940E9F6|nr:SIMPL domain-containing protein [Rhodovulum sp. ES.010]